MLEWIWFWVLLIVMLGLIAWDVHHDFVDGDATMLRVLISMFCFMLCLYIKSDLLVDAPYEWLLNVLPEHNTAINWFTAVVLTGVLVLVYLLGVVLGTYFVAESFFNRKKKERA